MHTVGIEPVKWNDLSQWLCDVHDTDSTINIVRVLLLLLLVVVLLLGYLF